MTTRIAPWLEGLSDAWEIPTTHAAPTNVSSASHDAGSLRSSRSQIPRRSLSGLPSSLTRRNSSSQKSTQTRRNPLAPLSKNDANTLRRHNGTMKSVGTRSMAEEGSDESVLACGTVQRRSKSSSPTKTQESLGWKRRLLGGKAEYGDQMDLFGPTGLENIFAPSKGHENEAPRAKKTMSWVQSSDIPMPSSPPPWPSNLAAHPQSPKADGNKLNSVLEESSAEQDDMWDVNTVDESFRSNPFDLERSDESHLDESRGAKEEPPNQSSPNKAFIEVSQEDAAANRTVSGQTELEQEDFSPVYVSKHKTLSGQVGYAAVDSHLVKKFQSTKVDLRHPSQQQPRDDIVEDYGDDANGMEPSTFTDGPESDALHAPHDISFSQNLPTGSPIAGLYQNIEIKRGGYSQYGSFKRRPLSPSQETAEFSLNPNASSLLSPLPFSDQQLPPAPTPPQAPSTPSQQHEPTPRSSGSPLKLFGAHDTFTSNRLLRRMSQLNPDGTLKLPPRESVEQVEQEGNVSIGSSFGRGQLDNHTFDAEITVTSASDSDKDGSIGSPGSEILPPGSKDPVGFRFEISTEVKETFKMKHKVSTPVASKPNSQKRSPARLQPTVKEVADSALKPKLSTEQEKRYGEGKRPPTSPFKDPTPKRRRTLHASELVDDLATVNQSYHNQLQDAVSSRKRKDARHGESQNIADSDTLAQRKILRPRNPTPSQHRRQQIETELREAAEEFAEQEPEKLEAVMEQIESSISSDAPVTLEQHAQALASEVAAFTLRVQKPSGEHGERKRSVTTQDFLNEAMMVMNLIRAKARPQSNLGSVEESEAEAFRQSSHASGPSQEGSLLRVSRPPSREGSGWRPRAPVRADARVASHLRKFQENEDKDDTDFIATSIASLHVDDDEQVNEQVVVVDEKSNIRITGPPTNHGKDKAESDSRPVSQRSQGSTLNTQDSNGTSTGRTIGTSSTRKSDNVGTLAPDAVAHLIGEQVGGMAFDKEKQRWVRLSKSPDKGHGSFLELPSQITSDDDPFREISDLHIDEQNEYRRISSPAKLSQEQTTRSDKVSVHQQADESVEQLPAAESRTTSQETVVPRPTTKDGSLIHPMHSSSVPSRYTAFASSQQQEKIETRATSWSDEELAKISTIGKARDQPLAYAAAQILLSQRKTDGQQDIEISRTAQPSPLYCEGRGISADVAACDHATALSSNILDEEELDEVSEFYDDTALDLQYGSIEDIDSPKLRKTPSKRAHPPSSTYQAAMRQRSLRQKALGKALDREAVEASELSFVASLPGDRLMSLSLSVSRPLSNYQQPRVVTELESSPLKGYSSYILSDLPEFTVHDVDEERSSEKALAKQLAHHAATEVNDRYALAIKDLVKILMDVYEREPYWEDLRKVELRKRSLGSLYGLEEFCTHVQDLDVSSNALTQLEGAPSSIRMLNASSNKLSSLTPWDNLMNLQYLDISNNQLENLDGLGCLIHLRELRADDNAITKVDGVFELNGLLKLRLRRNKLQQVNFEGCQLQRLTELDLGDNQILVIEHLDSLTSLSKLRLDDNDLEQGLRLERTLQYLKYASLQRCSIQCLDISGLPNLRYLHLDDNSLSNVDGLSTVQDLKLLSIRRQSLPESERISVFDERLEARTVRLSGNTIPSLRLSNNFLNLQHLEMASVGLQEIPNDFGLRMPNLRTLNLNFNRLKDIRPILNIQNLKRVSACGNRINRLRKSVVTFGKMNGLESLDLRDNPLTQGFYPNISSTMSKETCVALRAKVDDVEDEDQQAEMAERTRYEVPAASANDDGQYRARLDEDTMLRRRVYDIMVANSCRTLKELDGLKFDKGKAVVKDRIWDRLVVLGIIRSRGDTTKLIDDGINTAAP